MRYPAAEKLEIIRLVERSHLPVRRTLRHLGIPPATFYRWCERHQTGGPEALEDRPSRPGRVWNRIPDEVRGRVLDLALAEPELSPRELAVRLTDRERHFVSEASVDRPLAAHDLIAGPAFVVVKAADEFHTKTTGPDQLWQTDFTGYGAFRGTCVWPEGGVGSGPAVRGERVMSARRSRAGRRARYRVRDWATYDRALARRGDITVWVSPDAVSGWRAPAGRRTVSDAAIAAALTVRAVYRLALRQAEGLIASIFALLRVALPVPDHTTLSRRGRVLHLDPRAAAGPDGLDLAIDATGLRLARPPGAGHAGWRKLHVAVDPDSGRILAEELTHSGVHDSAPVPAMLGRIMGRLGRVYGDGAYAGGPTHRAVAEHRQPLPNAEGVFRPKAPDVRGADGLDPLTGRGRNARHVARDGRAAWERATGYGRRNAAEWTFSRLKRVLGGRLRSRGLDAQRVEAGIAVRALNRLGRG